MNLVRMQKNILPTFSDADLPELCDQLAKQERLFAVILANYGYPPFWSRPNTYESLVHIILEQQVSLASALATLHKLQDYTTSITPEAVLELTANELRACYVSRQKANYIQGLAAELQGGNLDLTQLAVESNDTIRSGLLELKGIGNWTVDVYLLMVLHRSDIFPVGDIAAVNACKQLFELPKNTPQEELLRIADKWRPYRSIATMLLWHYYLSSKKPTLKAGA